MINIEKPALFSLGETYSIDLLTTFISSPVFHHSGLCLHDCDKVIIFI